MNLLQRAIAQSSGIVYRSVRPLLFRTSAQDAHERTLELLAYADDSPLLATLTQLAGDLTRPQQHLRVGGITLEQPLILAAGFVKGHGYNSEDAALAAVERGINIMPGWQTIPHLAGLVEFGSFTRYPRIGNPGTVIWRDASTCSTQNRVGLKNPGTEAAAAFLQQHLLELPHQFGINLAVSPGIDDETTETTHITESIHAFLRRGVVPNWFTLNISCPNTEDDPSGNQTEAKTRRLCEAALQQIHADNYQTPLWVKISPDLSGAQYHLLMRVFADVGVAAVIATNTLGRPVPDNPSLTAGVGGGRLHSHALAAASLLQREAQQHDYPVDVIGCGGILDGDSYLRYKARGIHVVQYWSALVYRGPLAAAIIESEIS